MLRLPSHRAKAHTAVSGKKVWTSIHKLQGQFKGTSKVLGILAKNDKENFGPRIEDLTTNLATVTATVKAIVDGVPAIVSGLTALKDAVSNSTTGLVGLNLARPQFGVFTGAGVIQGGTGQATGGSGPKANVISTGAVPGGYVIDFGNDVSKRVYTVNVFPSAGHRHRDRQRRQLLGDGLRGSLRCCGRRCV